MPKTKEGVCSGTPNLGCQDVHFAQQFAEHFLKKMQISGSVFISGPSSLPRHPPATTGFGLWLGAHMNQLYGLCKQENRFADQMDIIYLRHGRTLDWNWPQNSNKDAGWSK
eukprot:TRINITY_DN68032_c5_g2_i9.p2 TRINITY_DN68032_c5_g2~~TRINITY_DN68032_c5_g2_i9.p2  ORF type:complete len:111 (+),score=5.27 TRINITY_DN68032_c5_g2_i9:440-772(+)